MIYYRLGDKLVGLSYELNNNTLNDFVPQAQFLYEANYGKRIGTSALRHADIHVS
jgi:hypothetical protein